MHALHERIVPAVEERQDAYVGLLSSLLRFQTVSGSEHPEWDEVFRRERARAWRFLRHEAERLGLDFRNHEDEAVAIEWEGRDPEAPSLGIAMHVDVVPAGADWQVPPFSGAVVDGEIWGRGTQDDKGPIAMSLAAIDVLQRLDIAPQGSVVLLIGSHEETTDWPDVDLLLSRERTPDHVLVPDGAFPIGIGEKGIATVEWHARWEPQDVDGPLRLERLEGGRRPNVVPAEARLTFTAPRDQARHAHDRLERLCLRMAGAFPDSSAEVVPIGDGKTAESARLGVRFKGRAAHAALPHEGHNAVLDALGFLTFVPEAGPAAVAFAQAVHARTRAIDASGVGLARSHAELGETTLNLGRVSMDGRSAVAAMNIRFPLGVSTRDVHDACRDAIAYIDTEVETRLVGRPQEPFLCEPADHPRFFEAVRTAYRTVTGVEARELTIAGTTYAKLFDVAVGFGPVDLARDEPVLVHQVDERVSVERYLENIRIYALALALLTAPQKGGACRSSSGVS